MSESGSGFLNLIFHCKSFPLLHSGQNRKTLVCQTEQDPLPKSSIPHHLSAQNPGSEAQRCGAPSFSLSSRSSSTLGKWKSLSSAAEHTHIKKPRKVYGNEFPIVSSSFSLCTDKQLFMHAVYVLACTLQLTTFSLWCSLSKPDMLSLYQCGKLPNTVCSRQWAAVPVGNTMKHIVIPAAALWHMHLLVIKSQNRATCSSQLHQHNPSNLWILKKPWDGVLRHALTSHEETRKSDGWGGHSASRASSC